MPTITMPLHNPLEAVKSVIAETACERFDDIVSSMQNPCNDPNCSVCKAKQAKAETVPSSVPNNVYQFPSPSTIQELNSYQKRQRKLPLHFISKPIGAKNVS